jgi:type I restriction enzyme, R subunit
VDMLDTGIDVPEVVNLVFFKLVRSKTKFWQMVGRGTRLQPDLFAPGQSKTCFYLFDYCQNLEFFSQQLPTTEGSHAESLGRRLFKARLELIGELDERAAPAPLGAVAGPVAPSYPDARTDADVRRATAERLHGEVKAMNLENFVVRPKRRLVEKYARPESWSVLPPSARDELATEVAGLPTELDPENEEAKRFDLLMLRLQLSVLKSEPWFERLRDQVREIAGALEEKASIPMVQAQMALILDLQTDEWWQDVTVPMLESARRRVRDLVRFIDKRKRKPIYSDFEDLIGAGTGYSLPGFGATGDFERFRAKARAFLREHQDHVAIQKLRMNRPLTATDLEELERILAEAGVGGAEDINQAKAESQGLGLFIRSLVGMDRGAAKTALAGFLDGKPMKANQIEFVNLVVDQLTDHGVMPASLLYESPFTDISPSGPEGLFTSQEVEELVEILDKIRDAAAAA